jgi:hypothetical protein
VVYRCWYRDGSARLVHDSNHKQAGLQAQELAGLANGDMPKEGHEDRQAYLDACKVVKTECLTDGSVRNWK